MATAQLEKVQEFLSCAICTDIYTDPCTLACQHTFCRKCITDYTKTRPEALQTKTIPCPSCRQVTKVPDPTRPVGEWAKQIKPSIIILGLIDTSQPGPATAATGPCCDLCEQLGETTPATSWCPVCHMALCIRCTKTHRANPASSDHDVCKLSSDSNFRRMRKDFCPQHKKICIEFHCKDCNKSACQKCCALYHRGCKSVLDIESMKEEMTTTLKAKQSVLSKKFDKKSANIRRREAAITEISQNKMLIKSNITSTTQRIIDRIKEKEKKLMDKLNQVTEKQLSQLQADVKAEEIEILTYRQHYEFIDQALNSDSLMDMYHTYLACESGALIVGDVRDSGRNEIERIKNIRLTQDPDKLDNILTDLKLGEIDVTDLDTSSEVMSTAVLLNTIDIRTKNDEKSPKPYGVTVLNVDDTQTVIVTDVNNKCMKSFYTRHGHSCHSRLLLDNTPRVVTRLKENQVIVAVPDSKQIVTVGVTPNLLKVSTLKTSKMYCSLAVLSPSSIAAGYGDLFTSVHVDILTMAGQVTRSITHHYNVELFRNPYFMCVNKRYLLVSDRGKKAVICITSEGDVFWQYAQRGHGMLRGPRGITTTGRGDILLADADSKRLIQLTERGDYIGDLLTSKNGLTYPRGIHRNGTSLFVCDDNLLKEFRLS